MDEYSGTYAIFPDEKYFGLVQRIPLLFFLLLFGFSTAQEDCMLGVGGKDDETIIEVFQLNEEQVENLRNWGAELKYRNSFLNMQAKALLTRHAQSSPEDLLSMSYEYQALVDSMRINMRMIDKRLLSLFNDQQYNLYIKLCNNALLSPIFTERQLSEK